MPAVSQMMLENEENVPVMEGKARSSHIGRCLPPNVSGNSRGFLELSLDKIQWNVTSYPGTVARIIWWGESYEDACVLHLNSSSGNCINYSVCTNGNLFHKYLTSCEAIEVQFSAARTNPKKGEGRKIGSAFISIPEVFLKQNNDFYAPVSYSDQHKIYSSKNTCVGVLKVTMKLIIFEDLSKTSDPLSERNEISMARTKDYLNYKKKPFFTRPESVLSNLSYTRTNSSSKIWTFLRGKDMSPRDEALTLREMTQSSPANSVIHAMDEELTWKLRDFHLKRNLNERLYKCHNNPEETPVKDNENNKSSSQSNGLGTNSGTIPNSTRESLNEKDEKEQLNIDTDPQPSSTGPDQSYQGVFYVGGFRNQHPYNRVPNVFAIAKSVSNIDDALIKTHLSDPNLFINYLKLFPVQIEASHLDSVMKHNSLNVELWSRYQSEDGQDVKLGTVTISLHPFYVAFRSEIVRQRLFDLSMPVIAVDGWAMVKAADGSSIGQLEVVLAIGTQRQVDYFVQSKELMNRRMESPPVSTRSTESVASSLSSFLDNLTRQMTANQTRQEDKGKLTKTSDLLDILQRSLATPPTTGVGKTMTNGIVKPNDVTDSKGSGDNSKDFVKISLEIECAMHLPRVSGDYSPRSSSTSDKEGGLPSTYATFEARITKDNKHDLVVDSVEGKVFATTVVARSLNPAWNKQFIVDIPKDLLTHPEKYFIIKIWRKAVDDDDLNNPTPLSDEVIGFCTVDLKVLTAGLPEIAGCYNIVYFDGKCNGQLQLKLKPLEAIQHRDVLDTMEMSSMTEELPVLDLCANPDMSLSRTLKRKFTELDEITERLRARLHDVTSEDINNSDDEFETYLNTGVDEVDEELEQDCGDVVDAVKDDFNWLGNLSEMQREFLEMDRKMQKNSQTLNELLERSAQPGTSANGANMYTMNGGGAANAAVESLETALKDAVLSDRSDHNSK